MKRSPLVRRTPLTRSTRIPAQSVRRRGEARRRKETNAWVIASCRGRCVWCGSTAGLDVHEIASRGRYPGSHMHPEVQVALCRPCHRHATDHPAWAERVNLAVPSGQWERAIELATWWKTGREGTR